MEILVLIGIGLLTGVTTVLFGFGGGFVTVPVVVWSDAALGSGAMRVATATSALVMLVNAGFATAATRRNVLTALRGRALLLALLARPGFIRPRTGASEPGRTLPTALGAPIGAVAAFLGVGGSVPDRAYAWSYLGLLGLVTLAMLVPGAG